MMNLILALSISVLIQQNPTIEIKGLNNENIAKPVMVDLPINGFKPSVQNYMLRSGDLRVPMQIVDDGQKAVFILPPEAKGNLTFEIFGAKQDDDGFKLNQSEKSLHVLEGSRPVITYNFGVMSKEGVPEDRNRSGYIHPVYGLEGEIITDDFPSDHYHHRGLYWGWPRVIVNGKRFDIWHMQGIKPRFEEWLYQEAGPVCASFGLHNGWYTADGKVVDERADITVYCADENGQAVDVRLELHAVKDTVQIGGQLQDRKGYGGFMYRPSPRSRQDTFLTSSAGNVPRDTDLDEYPWGDFSAKWAGGDVLSGMAIFSSPLNPKHPPGWIFRYYGYLGVSWPGLDLYTIEPGGEPLVLHYRVWIHKGNAEEGKTAQAFGVYDKGYSSVEFK